MFRTFVYRYRHFAYVTGAYQSVPSPARFPEWWDSIASTSRFRPTTSAAMSRLLSFPPHAREFPALVRRSYPRIRTHERTKERTTVSLPTHTHVSQRKSKCSFPFGSPQVSRAKVCLVQLSIPTPTSLQTFQSHWHTGRVLAFPLFVSNNNHNKKHMARGKFNKRGGGPRLDAVNAQEIALRDARLADLEDARAARRLAEEEEADGDEKDDTEPAGAKTPTPVVDNGPKGPPVTTEYDHRRNMVKLAMVRKRREEAEARRQAEEDIEQQQEDERKKMAAMIIADQDDDDEDDNGKKKKKNKDAEIPKLDKVTIKRMKPAQMKEALKIRGLDIQGNAKILLERLLKFEEAR
jgi:hypothetical protein